MWGKRCSRLTHALKVNFAVVSGMTLVILGVVTVYSNIVYKASFGTFEAEIGRISISWNVFEFIENCDFSQAEREMAQNSISQETLENQFGVNNWSILAPNVSKKR